MQGSDDPAASTEAHQAAFCHYQEQGQRSSSSSAASSPSSSPRVSTYADHKGFDNPAMRRAQGSTASTSAEAALKPSRYSEPATAVPDTYEDTNPYPLWTRPSTGAKAAEPPRRPSSCSSSSLPAALAPSSSSSSCLLSAPAPITTPNSTPPAAKAVPARPIAPCQHPGCSTHAKYGPKDATPIACQAHKRIGQYTTNRHGELLRATKHGNAFRTPPAPSTMGPPPASTGTTGTARQPPSDGSGKHSSSRKAARPSSSPVQGVKRKSRPVLSGVDDDEFPAPQKSRSCLFPGCDAQPVYGLAAAVHPVYCFCHKKGQMVPIVKEVPGLQGNGGAPRNATAAVARKGAASKSRDKSPVAAVAAAAAGAASGTATATAEGSHEPPTTSAYKNGIKKALRVPKGEGDSSDGGGEDHTKKNRGNGGKSNQGGSVASKVDGPPATSDSGRGTSTDDAVLPRPAAASSGIGHVSGMAPSAEIGFIRRAREAAKKEAEAAGGGKRARAPSRRALEASGRMTDQGAQWMTQEKRVEQARAAMELREQRKRYRAAGLKLGVVLEEFVVEKAGTVAAAAAAAGTTAGAAGSGASDGGSDSRREGGDGGSGPPATVCGWQKVSPVALPAHLEQAGAQETAAPVAAGERP